MIHDFQDDIDAIGRIDIVETILDVVCRSTGMGFAAVARVTEGRWIACQVLDTIDFGLTPGGELAVRTTICDAIRTSGTSVVIDHVAEDPTFRDHATPALYGFQSYISVPIRRRDGSFFGTLCAIDRRPARLSNPETLGMFNLFADLIAFHMDANDRLALSEASLRREREDTALREKFIAVLGHDLRNPLAALDAGAKMLARSPLDAKGQKVVGLMQGAIGRMGSLIDDVLDFARGHLGSGLTLHSTAGAPLDVALGQVLEESRAQWPDRVIEADVSLRHAVACDTARIGQLFSNLLGNALVHGAADQPVRVTATTGDAGFELAVCNGGPAIDPEAMGRLFEPFYRSAASAHGGLGLGLYIASEIARAHGGTLDVTSDGEVTCFTFRMPLA